MSDENEDHSLIKRNDLSIRSGSKSPILSRMLSEVLPSARKRNELAVPKMYRVGEYEFQEFEYRKLVTFVSGAYAVTTQNEIDEAIIGFIDWLSEQDLSFYKDKPGFQMDGFQVENGIISSLVWAGDDNENEWLDFLNGLRIRKLFIERECGSPIFFNPNLPNLKELHCIVVKFVDDLAIESHLALERLYFLCCELKYGALYIHDLSNLRTIVIDNCDIVQFTIWNCPRLENILCSWANLPSIDSVSRGSLRTLRVQAEDLSFCSDLFWISLAAKDTAENTEAEGSFSTYLKGMSQLRELLCHGGDLSSLDTSDLRSLNELDCSYNRIEDLNLEYNDRIELLDCSHNRLSMLNLRNLDELKEINCSNNALSEVVLPDSSKLLRLDCSNNRLDNIDFTKLQSLEEFNCADNNLQTFDLKDLPNLKRLDCAVNLNKTLDVRHNVYLEFLSCGNYRVLEELHLGYHIHLKHLDCSHTALSYLNLSSAPNLEVLDIHDAVHDSTIDLSLNKQLKVLMCTYNEIESLDLSHCTELEVLDCRFNPNLRIIDIRQLTKLKLLLCDERTKVIGINPYDLSNYDTDELVKKYPFLADRLLWT